MTTALINLELSRQLQERLSLLQSQKPDYHPKFNKIISGLLGYDQRSLTLEQASQVVAKKQYALSRISQALGLDEEAERRRKFQQRLANLCADINEVWGEKQADSGVFDFANKLVTAALVLFASFKQRYEQNKQWQLQLPEEPLVPGLVAAKPRPNRQ